MGAEIPHWVDGRELDANGVVDWLRNRGAENGWRRVSEAEAQEMANQGQPCVAVWKNPRGIGHVAIVRPGEYSSSEGPVIAQAGGNNYNLTRINTGFGADKRGQIEYYVHD
jgi:hypothetical protein